MRGWWCALLLMAKSAEQCLPCSLRFFGASSKGEEALKGFTGGLTFATDAVAVLDAVGVGQATFICQSMGGTLGLHAAVHFPKRVAALVLCNTHMGVALPPRLQAIRKAHLRKVDELFGPAELFPRANTLAAIGASLGGKALGREFQKRNPELAYWYGVNGALNQVGVSIAASIATHAHLRRVRNVGLRSTCRVHASCATHVGDGREQSTHDSWAAAGAAAATGYYVPGDGHEFGLRSVLQQGYIEGGCTVDRTLGGYYYSLPRTWAFGERVVQRQSLLLSPSSRGEHKLRTALQVYFEDPDGFNYALMDWLQQHVPSTTKSPTDGLL